VCSWVTTLEDLGTSTAQCVSNVVNILYKRVKSKRTCISTHLKMTVAGCDAMQSGKRCNDHDDTTVLPAILVQAQQTTQCHNPDDSHHHIPQYEPQISLHMKVS
jgi:hypothetical protein